jgi:hypothetical protein
MGPLGILTVNYDTGSTLNIPVSGEALRTTMAMSTSALEFGPVCVGDSAMQHVIVSASNAGAFKVTDVSMPAAPFSLVTPTMPWPDVTTQTTFEFDVRVMPTVVGDSSDITTITTDIPGSPPASVVHLTAKGLPPGIAVTPDALDFGINSVDTTSSGKTVEFTNCSTGNIAIESVTLDGPDFDQFAIVLPADPLVTLPPLGSEEITLVMRPKSNGPKLASLIIGFGGDSRTVDLAGGGKDGVDKVPPERETYYACSTGRPGAVWPIAFALLGLCRRRRRSR